MSFTLRGTTYNLPAWIENLMKQFKLFVTENIPANSVTTDTAQTISAVKTFSATPKTDAIAENTAAAGVTIDGVLLKDSDVIAADVRVTSELATDVIIEVTADNGVDVDGVLCKDADIYVSGVIAPVLIVCADEAAAIANGTLVQGQLYKTATGEVRVKL